MSRHRPTTNRYTTMKRYAPARLRNKVQDYAWGGTEFIPQLLNRVNFEGKPQAELWMGTHPKGPSKINIGLSWRLLADYLADEPDETLGAVAEQSGDNLPFLFKVLDVQSMLSIQAHPTRAAAKAGFARENAAGIPVTAPHRNYRDENHKPEVMVALTDFWLLHGFKTADAIEATLSEVPELAFLQEKWTAEGLKGLYRYVMELPQDAINAALKPLYDRLHEAEIEDKDNPDYWAQRAFEEHTHKGNFDRGIFSIYLFNLVRLAKGQGIYQAANVPHAYLEGVNVELMANSDNVFRGGLTVKHVDVPELMQHLRFEGITPQVLEGAAVGQGEYVYATEADDFELSRLDLPKGESYQRPVIDVPEVWLVLEGSVRLGGERFGRGDSFFVPAVTDYRFEAEEDALLFKATCPR